MGGSFVLIFLILLVILSGVWLLLSPAISLSGIGDLVILDLTI